MSNKVLDAKFIIYINEVAIGKQILLISLNTVIKFLSSTINEFSQIHIICEDLRNIFTPFYNYTRNKQFVS